MARHAPAPRTTARILAVRPPVPGRWPPAPDRPRTDAELIAALDRAAGRAPLRAPRALHAHRRAEAPRHP